MRQALSWFWNRVREGRVFHVDGGRVLDFGLVDFRDYGDVEVPAWDHERALRRIADAVGGVLADGRVPIAVGGDHSVTYGCLLAAARAVRGHLGLIQVDAHLDLLDDSPRQGRFSGSSWLRRALELESYRGRNVVQIGVRGYNYAEHHAFVQQQGILQVTSRQLAEEGPAAVARRALARAREGTEAVYLTLDIDAVDSPFGPGSGWMEPGGLTSQQLLELVWHLAPAVHFFDVTEVNPAYDVHGMTAGLAARAIFDFMAARVTAALEGGS